ncbi:MAG: RsiV family protein, partial [Bacillota bacterium]|nr:RsiV family protein [Bacillota bacterium]
EKEELISKMTDEERREYLQERKPLFSGFKKKDKDRELFVPSFINKKTLLIIIGIIVALVAAVFIVKGLDHNNKTEQIHSTVGEKIADAGENYEVTTEKKKEVVFINDDTEILVQTVVDVPTITGNDALDSSVKEWAGSYEEQADDFKEQYNSINYEDLEYLDAHSDVEFYDTEYPIYFYLRNIIYVPEEGENFLEIPRVDDKILSLIYCSYIEDGGAHGYSVYSAGNFDVESSELLSLDMIADDYDAFSDVTLSYIMNQVEKKNEEMMLYGSEMFSDYEDTIRSMWSEYSPNWYMSDNGLIFIYNVYELAPYADGPIIIEVPYSEVSEYMNADYVKDNEQKKDYSFDGSINSEKEACDYVWQYLYDNNYGVDGIHCEGADEDSFVIRGYDDMGTHITTRLLWTVDSQGNIYDEDGELID